MNTQPPDQFDAALRHTWRDAAAHLPGPLQMQSHRASHDAQTNESDLHA